MSAELDALVAQLLPWQREIYDAVARGERVYWQSGRKGGRWAFKQALDLREKESKMRYINQLQSDVTEFHEAFNHPAPTEPVMELTPEIIQQLHDRADWLREEANELDEALEEGNLVKVLDALGDGIYFGVGGYTVLGHEMLQFWNNIHVSNMEKLDADGKPIYGGPSGTKIQKPEGWVPPEAKHEATLREVQLGLDADRFNAAADPVDLGGWEDR